MNARIYNVGRNGVGVFELLLGERFDLTPVVGELSEDKSLDHHALPQSFSPRSHAFTTATAFLAPNAIVRSPLRAAHPLPFATSHCGSHPYHEPCTVRPPLPPREVSQALTLGAT
ncbi:unnamed protein product [Sphenostylis stenocarpa]|uniref:Uncharacterized protein n=1 Tax=Sphenostylis stenocarpa TaxID=92480 RepID=A0AA86SGI8_9FABA|nr:unnamed protein product [Sphenostylis stenocarpa]